MENIEQPKTKKLFYHIELVIMIVILLKIISVTSIFQLKVI